MNRYVAQCYLFVENTSQIGYQKQRPISTLLLLGIFRCLVSIANLHVSKTSRVSYIQQVKMSRLVMHRQIAFHGFAVASDNNKYYYKKDTNTADNNEGIYKKI